MARSTGLSFDENNPLERATDISLHGREPLASVRGLNDYYLLGPTRSIQRLWNTYEEAKKANPQYKIPINGFARAKTYAMRYAWVERAKLADAIHQRELRERLDNFWLEARTTIPLRDYQQSEKLRELADKTLQKLEDFIEEHEETRNGQTVVYKRADIRAVIDALKLASELQRKAAGMDAKQTAVTGQFDLNRLPNEYLDRVIAGEDIATVWEDYRAGTNSNPNDSSAVSSASA